MPAAEARERPAAAVAIDISRREVSRSSAAPAPLLRRAVAEFLGTALLLIAVVGSGIAAQRLSPNDTGLELLENAVATGAALVAIILAVGPVSGAHLNPVVSAVDAAFGGLRRTELAVDIAAQVCGGVAGVVIANLMYSLSAVSISGTTRSSGGHLLSEVVATFGLLLVIFGLVRAGRAATTPFAVGAYITGAYFFTSSTSFANPAVTIARMFSDTFAGIAPGSVPGFIGAQVVGAGLAAGAIRALLAADRRCRRRGRRAHGCRARAERLIGRGYRRQPSARISCAGGEGTADSDSHPATQGEQPAIIATIATKPGGNGGGVAPTARVQLLAHRSHEAGMMVAAADDPDVSRARVSLELDRILAGLRASARA